jgi:type I restriction enzyme S subunit
MTKLEKLLAELCPDGVEYKALGDVATEMYRGSGIKRDEVTEDGSPCVRYGEIYTTYGIWFDKCVSHTHAGTKTFEHGDILFAITGESVEEIAKSCAYVGHEKCMAGGDIVVMKHNQDPKYLAYALSTTNAQAQKSKGKVKSKVVHASVPALQAIEIPLPPLSVQREIVRILDNFTELTAELTARKKQYEYYRNELLSFDDNVPMMSLGEVAKMLRGDYVTKKQTKPGNIPVILGGQEPAYYCDKSNHLGKAIVISRSGAYAGFVSYWDEPIFVTDGFILEPTDKVTIRYLFHWLKNKQNDLYSQKRGGGVPHVRGTEIMGMSIFVPFLAEQARIVEILDKFDALTTDITAGLPAEIAARQKQYEYYRDKLLSFQERAQ